MRVTSLAPLAPSQLLPVKELIHPTGRKATKRKVKEQVADLVLDLVTKEMSTLGATNVKNNTMFERYVLAQEKKANAALNVVELRDRHQSLKEREQHLKEMKYEDRILLMNIVEMCLEDKA